MHVLSKLHDPLVSMYDHLKSINVPSYVQELSVGKSNKVTPKCFLFEVENNQILKP